MAGANQRRLEIACRSVYSQTEGGRPVQFAAPNTTGGRSQRIYVSCRLQTLGARRFLS